MQKNDSPENKNPTHFQKIYFFKGDHENKLCAIIELGDDIDKMDSAYWIEVVEAYRAMVKRRK